VTSSQLVIGGLKFLLESIDFVAVLAATARGRKATVRGRAGGRDAPSVKSMPRKTSHTQCPSSVPSLR
jgi:hypothetical protein